jgi:hypothetical protein
MVLVDSSAWIRFTNRVVVEPRTCAHSLRLADKNQVGRPAGNQNAPWVPGCRPQSRRNRESGGNGPQYGVICRPTYGPRDGSSKRLGDTRSLPP